MSILLIAGHGEGDSGATGQGYKEADLAREVVAMLDSELYGDMEYYVYNTDLNCYRQCKNNYCPDWTQFDYVMEIHFNAYNGSARGTEILKDVSRETHEIEDEMLEEMERFGFTNRGVKTRTNLLNMSLCTRAGVDYALFEICFIDSRVDMAIYEQYKTDIVSAIADILKKYFGETVSNASLYKVQVGAFSKRANAENLEAELLTKGYDTYIVQEGALYKVQVGAFKDKDNAVALVNRLENDGYETYLRGGA